MSGDWKIGDDRRRRTTDQIRAFQKANDGRGRVGHLGPRRLHLRVPPRPGARGRARTSRRSRASWRSSATGSSPDELRRDDVDLLDGELVRYVLPERRDGQSVAEVLDFLEDNGLRTRGSLARPLGARLPWRRRRQHVPGHRAAGDRAHRAVAAGRPAGEGREVSVVVVDTGWHPPAATDPRTPWLQGREGRRRAQRPRPATVRRPRHLHRRCRAVPRPADEDLRGGLRDRRRRWRRDPGVRPRRAARGGAAARPAGHQPLGRLPHPPRPALDRARGPSTAST